MVWSFPSEARGLQPVIAAPLAVSLLRVGL